jgi:hypothetical protein
LDVSYLLVCQWDLAGTALVIFVQSKKNNRAEANSSKRERERGET